jgi:asparagine synthase (glutamine-hydrolysing)
MTTRLRHRGPDADGYWSDRDAGVAFGHRRLAIIDLTDAGRQPMFSHSGRFVITFNGEIYNYRLLRRELERQGQNFVGNSDTEVLLAMIERWGLETALRRSNGMFAIGLWDRWDRILHLARDRMGKKPLYVARTRNAVAFASELKAIAAFPDFVPEINPRAVAEFLAQGWLPEDHCICKTSSSFRPVVSCPLVLAISGFAGRYSAADEGIFLVVGDRCRQERPYSAGSRR